jgi:leader peptidase (prepilin peptidase)/N-methyltransferase
MLYLVRFAFTLLMRQEAMGLGDIKLLAMIGAFLGVRSLLFVVFASSLIGSVVGIITIVVQRRGRRTPIPFGPFLALGAMLFLFFQERIFEFWAWYAAGRWQ